MAQEPVIAYVVSPVWGLSSASPFCVKLETWMRMAEIPFELRPLSRPAKSKTGKVPYIERPDGSLLADSQRIIETLEAERGVSLDGHLDAQQRAVAHLVRKTIEESLYFAILWQRWAVDENWPLVRDNYFSDLPFLLRKTVPAIIRTTVGKQLHSQGTGRREAGEVYACAETDVAALARVLDEHDFFFRQPSTTDAIAYAFLSSICAAPIEDRIKRVVEQQANLTAFCERMRARYFR